MPTTVQIQEVDLRGQSFLNLHIEDLDDARELHAILLRNGYKVGLAGGRR